MISMLRRFRARFGRGWFEQEMDDELRFHLESLIQDNIRAGMDPEQARRIALLNFGGFDKTKEECRDTRWVHLLNDLRQDLRYATRTLLKNRGFAFAAMGTLALGIGATTTIFSVVYSTLFPTFPFPAPDRLVYVGETDRQGRGGFAPSLPTFIDWRTRNDVFEELAAYRLVSLAWNDREEPVRIQGVKATANIFRKAGVRPSLGRDFDPDSDPGVGRVTFLVRTSGDPKKLARTLRKEAWNLDPHLPIDALQTIEDLFEPHIARPRFYLGLFGFFALVAVFMAGIGIYGLISYSVEQRTQEIGIRIAMGAQGRDVLAMVLKHGLILVLIGASLGLAGAVALTRFLRSFLFGVAPTDIPTFCIYSVVLIALAALACLVPARRATRVDPMIALRSE